VSRVTSDTWYLCFVCLKDQWTHVLTHFSLCSSGTVLDLPYVFVADGEEEEMHENSAFDMNAMAGLAGAAGIAMALASGADPIEVAMQACCAIL